MNEREQAHREPEAAQEQPEPSARIKNPKRAKTGHPAGIWELPPRTFEDEERGD